MIPTAPDPSQVAPLRVVILGHTAALGGAELALLRLVAALPSGDLDVRVVLFETGPLADRIRAVGHRVEVLELTGRAVTASRATARSPHAALRWVGDVAPVVARLLSLVRAWRPDVLVSTTLKTHLIASALPSRVPLVWHLHDRVAPDYLPWGAVHALRALARWRPAVVVANSQASAATLPGAPVRVVYPGLAPAQVLADPAWRTAPTVPLIGLVGRISPTKGQVEFVRAASRVRRVRPEATFEIVGAPLFGADGYARQMEHEIDLLGLRDAITVRGPVADPTAVLDRLTVLVHASPTPEPFGQVVAEALARGVPVVATEAGGIPEILLPADGAPLGRLVPPGDVTALADAILATLADPDLAASSERGWRHVSSKLTIDATAAAIVAAWREAARGKAPRKH